MLSKRPLEQTYPEHAKDLLWTLSAQGVCGSLSPRAAQITGWSEVDCIGKPFHSFIHPDDIGRLRNAYTSVLDGEMVRLEDLRFLARNGSFRAFTLSLVPGIQHHTVLEVLVLGYLSESDTAAVIALPQNVLPFSSNEEKSASSPTPEYAGLAKLLESLLANAPVGFALLDEELRLVCLNQTFSGMTGFSPEQQLGLFFSELLPGAAPVIMPMLREILVTGNSVLDHEVVFQRSAAAELSRYALMSFYPIPDWHGGICGIATIALDITDRKRSDRRLKKISEELVRSNQALEAFCYIASHDLNEPLRTISSFVQLLEVKYKGKLDHQANECIKFAVDGTHRMRRLIDGTLEFARAGKVERKLSSVDCREILETILSNLKVALEECHGTLTYDALPTVRGDRLLLLQVLQNLIANAIKYKGSSPCQIHVGVRSETGQWVFSVADNGIGISSEYLSAIFAPFRKLHSPTEYAGAGLGLAICQKNIERLGGRIWVTSEEGKGSVFYFTIPVAPSEEGQDHEPAGPSH